MKTKNTFEEMSILELLNLFYKRVAYQYYQKKEKVFHLQKEKNGLNYGLLTL